MALAQQAQYPLDTLVSVKRLMGRSYDDALASGMPFNFVRDSQSVKIHTQHADVSPVEVASKILEKLKFLAEGTLGRPGMVMMSPQTITMNSAPAASRTSRRSSARAPTNSGSSISQTPRISGSMKQVISTAAPPPRAKSSRPFLPPTSAQISASSATASTTAIPKPTKPAASASTIGKWTKRFKKK